MFFNEKVKNDDYYSQYTAVIYILMYFVYNTVS